jgi:biopolymer transport protein ExbD
MTKPNINVTPLIDVLLVLLIIFMVVSPLKPSAFKAGIPQEAKEGGEPNIHTLVVAVGSDSSLQINNEIGGTIEEPGKLITRLQGVFAERLENGAYSEGAANDPNLSEDEKIEKTVFIKAPRSLNYGRVAKVIDAVKQSGARPISLQIDDLNDN